jgi:anti-anti-sigma factor
LEFGFPVAFVSLWEARVKVGIRRAGRVTILDLDGSLSLGESEDTIREPLQQLIDSGSNRVAFNLANLTDLDSSGIGVLMRSFVSVSRAGGKSTFFSANHRVRMVLKMVRLDTVLDLVTDEATALSRL